MYDSSNVPDVNQTLASLVVQFCQHSPNALQYEQLKQKIIDLMMQSGRVWRSIKLKHQTPQARTLREEVYQIALSETWVWFFKNCQSIAKESQITTVFNEQLYGYVQILFGSRRSLEDQLSLPRFIDPEPDPLNEKLSILIREACKYSKGTSERRKLKTQLLSELEKSKRIRGRGGYSQAQYEEALQRTWLWFFDHLDEYDVTQAKVTTWFNYQLNIHCLAEIGKGMIGLPLPWDCDETVEKPVEISTSATIISPWEELISEEDKDERQRLFKRVKHCFQTKENQRLFSRVRLIYHPRINSWLMFQYRLPWIFASTHEDKYLCPLSWQDLADTFNQEFSLSPPITAKQLSRFYNERCFPLLQKLLQKLLASDSPL